MATTSPPAAVGDDAGVEPDCHATTGGTTRWQKAVGVLGLIAVLWAGNNLYDAISRGVVGPGGGGGHGPPGGTPTTQPVDVGDEAPPAGGGEHDPSQFDHG
jgi:hypothetical protein